MRKKGKKRANETGEAPAWRQGMNIWREYLKERSVLFLWYLLLTLIFLAVASLYGYDNSILHMQYAAVLALFSGLCGCFFDFIKYRGKCMKLQEALMKSEESDYYLPNPAGLAESLYYEIVCEAEKEKRRMVTELDCKREDMADYYTMWIHQIKTPIAALRLLWQRMDREEDSKGGNEEWQGKSDARQALEELFKIEQYAEMALHYARLDSMSSDMLFKDYDINVIIRHAVKKYGILFIGSGLSFFMGDFECRAVTDEKWFGFVVEQVLANALKYTSKGCIRIYGADTEGKECTGDVGYIVIEDTGAGIRKSDLPRIFERGFTGYNGRMGKKSTGIGLYLCKEIMDKLSHTIEVRSEEGEGTKVILGLKRVSAYGLEKSL